MIKENNKPMLPGEHIASIEEFEGGKNTYIASDGTVRSAAVGTKVYDLKRRIVKVDQKNSPTLPKATRTGPESPVHRQRSSTVCPV